jgi:hypothetical protein
VLRRRACCVVGVQSADNEGVVSLFDRPGDECRAALEVAVVDAALEPDRVWRLDREFGSGLVRERFGAVDDRRLRPLSALDGPPVSGGRAPVVGEVGRAHDEDVLAELEGPGDVVRIGALLKRAAVETTLECPHFLVRAELEARTPFLGRVLRRLIEADHGRDGVHGRRTIVVPEQHRYARARSPEQDNAGQDCRGDKRLRPGRAQRTEGLAKDGEVVPCGLRSRLVA